MLARINWAYLDNLGVNSSLVVASLVVFASVYALRKIVTN
jgi:hypothetical protein